jgi:hypothetical protein
VFIRTVRVLLLGSTLLAGCVPAWAQAAGSDRPFKGALFGGNRAVNSAQSLDISLSLLEAYDDDVFAGVGSTVTPTSRGTGGYFTALQSGIDYKRSGRRLSVGLSGASAFRYYPELRKVKSVSHTMGVGFSTQLGRRTTLLLNQTAAYSPSYLFGLFPGIRAAEPGDAITTAPDYAANNVESYAYGTTATLTKGFSPRTAVAISGDFQYTNYLHESAFQRDVRSSGMAGDVSYQRSKNAAVRIGYRYRDGDLGTGAVIGSTNEHALNVGLTYSHPVSATRRVSLAFNLGPSAVNVLEVSADAAGPARLYRAAGDVMMGYQFARAWQARGTYRRGLEFVAGLTRPVFTDAFTAMVDGLLSSRLDLQMSAGYSSGQSAVARTASRFDTYTGDVRFRYALAQSSAVHIEYLYYFYDFSGYMQPTPGVSPRLERNGVRAGLTLQVPALRR